jgi:phosphoribosylcarboxyaminoimidazole (NCAIR) mutase
MRKIAVIVGSDSDVKYCVKGIEELERHPDKCVFTGLFVRSPIFHPGFFQNLVLRLTESCDVIIVGAGKSHHPAVDADAILRIVKMDTRIPVIGVAFGTGNDNSERCLSATELSLTESPNSQVLSKRANDPDENFFSGEGGFFEACQYAIFGNFPEIKLFPPREMRDNLRLEDVRKLVRF